MTVTLMQNDEKKLQLLKDVFFKGASNEEFQLFVHACERTGLDPFMKQIHPVKRYDSNLRKEVVSIQTGIDGYRLIAERTGCYAPGKEPSFGYDKDSKLVSATAYVKKLTKDGSWHEISATAFFDEYCQKTKEGKPFAMWAKMPHGQLAKCAEALALRRAFPAELSGLYTKEEMDQSDTHKELDNGVNLEQKSPISKEQTDELATLLLGCSQDYIIQFWKFMKEKGIEKIDHLPLSMFDRVKKSLQLQFEKNKSVKAEEGEFTDYEGTDE